MAEYIECRGCTSRSCKGCNTYTLSKMLHAGKFNCLMDGNRAIHFADVAPVVHGRWVNEEMIVGGFAETWACDCSVCGRTQKEPLWKPNYCPNCGARMDGGAEHD